MAKQQGQRYLFWVYSYLQMSTQKTLRITVKPHVVFAEVTQR